MYSLQSDVKECRQTKKPSLSLFLFFSLFFFLVESFMSMIFCLIQEELQFQKLLHSLCAFAGNGLLAD